MLWTWDSYRPRASDAPRTRPDRNCALTSFLENVDLLFYAAAAALGACLLALFIG